MKNKRQVSKEQTNKKILLTTKKLIERKGALKLTTLEIAKGAKVAHGTIFAHFKTREALFIEVFKNEFSGISARLEDLTCDLHIRLKQFISNYINLLIEEEKMYGVIAREFPFYHEGIKKEVLIAEKMVKDLLVIKIQHGIENGDYKPLNAHMAVSFLFGALNFYISRQKDKELDNQSLKENKAEIIDTFFQLLSKK